MLPKNTECVSFFLVRILESMDVSRWEELGPIHESRKRKREGVTDI